MPSTRSLTAPALALAAALALGGCLGDPEPQSCADLPPGSPGCAVDGAPDDQGPNSDVAPPGDQGPDDQGPDGSAPGDQGPDPDGDLPDGDLPDVGGGECAPGTDRPCGSDEGSCVAGRQYCNADGVYEGCLGATEPGVEECNGLDDDCDAQTDEGCDCVGGDTQPCGSDEGECAPGVQTCVDGAWSACEGAIESVEEVCDGLDNNCNGEADEFPAVTEMRPCTVGRGRCLASGVFVCDLDVGGAPVCGAVAGAPVAETCNRQDDDCDGTTDEETAARINVLTAGQDPALKPVAIAPFGEFHGLAWIDDDRVLFGLALGDEWEVQPVVIGGYDGGDSGAEHIALTRAGNSFRLAVSSWDVGSGGVNVFELGPGGEQTGRKSIANSTSDGIDIAYRSNFGYAIAFEEETPGANTRDIAIDVVLDGAVGEPARYTISGGQAHLRQPSVTWADGDLAVAAINSDGRSTQGNLQISLFTDLGGVPRTTVVSRGGSAQNPDLVWLPNHARFLLAWDEISVEARDTRVPRVAVITLEGQVEATFDMPAIAAAEHPSLMPAPNGREAVDTIGVAWRRAQAAAFNIELGWLVRTERGWQVSPTVTSVGASQGQGAGPVAVWSDAFGVAYVRDDGRDPQAVFHTVDACPTRP